jgi:Tfp pilus assembly protein PilE
MKGFILTELIIVIGLITIFTGLTIFSYQNLESYFLTRSAKNEVLTVLDRARNLAISMYQSDGWSFRVEENKLLIYKGNNFDTRNQSYDEFYEVPKKVTATTSSDIYFAPITGFAVPATTTLYLASSTINILVNNNGNIK